MNDPPSIAIVGAGAIGGAVAGALGDAGNLVTLCVRTPFKELRVDVENSSARYGHAVVSETSIVDSVDWLLLCTKAHQIEGAADWFSYLLRDSTRVAILQNGVEHRDRIAPYLGSDNPVLPCVVRLPATVIEPGHVIQNRRGRLQVPAGELGGEFAALFVGQDSIGVEQVDDFTSAAWDKLVRNAISGICAVTRRTMGVLRQETTRDFVLGLIAEIKAVGEAEGAVFSEKLTDEFFASYAGVTGGLWTSIAQDAIAGRPTEWDARNAVVGRIGRKHNIPTPLNDALTTMLHLADEANRNLTK